MIVYVESNFVLELAFLQEEHERCLALLSLAESRDIHLVLPAFSIGEPYEVWVGVSKSAMEPTPVFGFRFSSFPIIQSLQAPPDGPPAGAWLYLPGYFQVHSFLCESLIY